MEENWEVKVNRGNPRKKGICRKQKEEKVNRGNPRRKCKCRKLKEEVTGRKRRRNREVKVNGKKLKGRKMEENW